MSSKGARAYKEHHFRRAIPGDIETVRRRLCDTLEEFHYVVLGEQPIQARRGSQKNVFAANVLEYDILLTIALKAVSPGSTLATFEYEVQHIHSKGERLALEREAEAVIALALAASHDSVCTVCNTENSGVVRFCRVCGTPVARKELPAELEVMRLAAEASGARVEMTVGFIVLLGSLIVFLPLIMLSSPRDLIAGLVFLVLSSLLSFFFLFTGMLRLRRMVNPPGAQEAPVEATRALSIHERSALPPQPNSVIEGTTELMEPEKMPVHAKDTDSIT